MRPGMNRCGRRLCPTSTRPAPCRITCHQHDTDADAHFLWREILPHDDCIHRHDAPWNSPNSAEMMYSDTRPSNRRERNSAISCSTDPSFSRSQKFETLGSYAVRVVGRKTGTAEQPCSAQENTERLNRRFRMKSISVSLLGIMILLTGLS